jgi:signal transduction histidine kinase
MSVLTAPPVDALGPLLEGLPCAAVLFDGDGQLVAANARAHGWLAVDARAPLATQRWDVVLLPMGEAAPAAAARVAALAQPETLQLSPGDTGRVVELRLVPVPEGRVLACATDVTDAVAQARATAQAGWERDAVLAGLPVPVWVADATGALVGRNPAAEAAVAGHAVPTVRALWELQAPHDLRHARPLSFLDAPAMRALAGQVVAGEPLELRRGADAVRVAVHAQPMRDPTGAVRGVVVVELPAGPDAAPGPAEGEARLAQLVEERSQALLASQEAQLRDRRLAAVGQLAAGVMHDVNNVLNPIMAAAYLLQHHAESPAAVRDYADRIRKAAETGAAIASRVGRFIRQEPLHGGDRPADLSAIAAEVLAFTEPAWRMPGGAAVRVVRDLPPGVWVRGIPGELREALVNLVQNGVDAMPAGGTLTVRAFRVGGDACVAVRDSGAGMSAEVRERAFEPFFTTKGVRGSGLGLAEVYGIASRHRGTASIASVPGRGTEVVLRLPAEAAPAGAEAGAGAGAASPMVAAGEAEGVIAAPGALRILVAEDQADSREFLVRVLRADGHAVEAVGDCAGARARLAAAPGGTDAASSAPFDLLLADAGLPDGDGWALVREAQQGWPTLRAGVVTGWDAGPEREEASGVAFVLRKPWQVAELQAHVAGPNRPVPDRG